MVRQTTQELRAGGAHALSVERTMPSEGEVVCPANAIAGAHALLNRGGTHVHASQWG